MGDDTGPRPERFRPANDNTGPQDEPDAVTWRKVDEVAIRLARIIGRRMAREDFERLTAANDNRPNASEATGDGADKE